jgi:peptidoglycan hydrolase-like protein with peptidoglycan-binding domain
VRQVGVRAIAKSVVVLAAFAAIATFGPLASAVAGPKLGSRTLRQGMKGSDVRALQQELNWAGIKTAVNGDFGAGTLRSVETFQRRFGLPVTGIVDAELVHMLTEVLFPDGQILGRRVLRQGMKGADVKVLQRDLSTTGYPTSVDGDFGPATRSSVVFFERDNNLPANGVVSYDDTLILRAMLAIVALHGHDKGLGPGYVSTPPAVATINSNGTATAPPGAPIQVQEVIAAANRIIHTPYVWGGGHASWNSYGYDCSGAVSYALHGAGLLSSPEDSTALESYGRPGPGKWISIYADASHAFLVVAGRAFDTADYGGPNIPSGTGPRWRYNPTGNLADGGGYIVRHPAGL